MNVKKLARGGGARRRRAPLGLPLRPKDP